MSYATKQCPRLGVSFPVEDAEIWVPMRPRRKASVQLASISSYMFLGKGTIGEQIDSAVY